MSHTTLFLSLFVLVSLTLQATAETGTATFYTPPYTPSACYGFTKETGLFMAVSVPLWDNKGACGRRYKVKCIGATNLGVPHPCKGGWITVRVIELCPSPGCRGTIDLSQEAFAMIADPNAGKIQISYQRRMGRFGRRIDNFDNHTSSGTKILQQSNIRKTNLFDK